ncbi:OmpA family protein [bacterium]|nr:OmpA family protein [bacterium]
MRRILHTSITIGLLCLLLPGTLRPQDKSDVALDELFAQAEVALEEATLDDLALLAPRAMRKANDNYAGAQSLRSRQSDERLVRIQLVGVLDEIKTARETAQTTAKLLNGALIARQAVLESGGNKSAPDSWLQAEDRLGAAVRDAEQGRAERAASEADEIAGEYWAIRREGLRNEILSSTKDVLKEAEKQGADRVTPTLMARAQQAMSRAETAVAQEDLDSARGHAQEAENLARQSIAMIGYADEAKTQKYPWEASLLPYEDLLLDIAKELGGTISFAPGGSKTLSQFERLIENRDQAYKHEIDSLRTALNATQASLEASLTESQTSLADAHHKIIELEKRLEDIEGARSKAREELDKKQETARQVTVAQAMFQPSEALVVQNEIGNVIIRVIGIQFASGKSSLTASQIALIGKVAKAVQTFPGASITVEGHTDSEGGEENNQKISERRAHAVAMELAKKLDIPASELTVAGYGETQPIADNSTKKGRAQNRRIDVLLEIP